MFHNYLPLNMTFFKIILCFSSQSFIVSSLDSKFSNRISCCAILIFLVVPICIFLRSCYNTKKCVLTSQTFPQNFTYKAANLPPIHAYCYNDHVSALLSLVFTKSICFF
ncbi:hypothetical protein Leryth_004645 [Lithospermum erythrorhizon]|nr:hypothetical protein Leryth_004645 [Lithospermum erythrorhizon]